MSEELKQIKEKMEQLKNDRIEYYKSIINVRVQSKDCFKGHWKRLSFRFVKYLIKKLEQDKLNRKMFTKGIKKILKKDNSNAYEIMMIPYSSCKLSFDVLNNEVWNNVKFALEMIEKYKEDYLKEVIIPKYKERLGELNE